MGTRSDRLLIGLAAFQVADAIAGALPLAYIKRDLDHIGCPPSLQPILPVLKGASAVGLVLGRRAPALAALTAAALVAYYAAAVTFHVETGDHPLRSSPAAALGVISAGILMRAPRAAQ